MPGTLEGMGSALKMIGDRGGRNLAKGGISAGTSYLLARHYHGRKDATAGRVVLGAAVGKFFPALVALFAGDKVGGWAMPLGALDAAGQGALDFLAVTAGLRHARQEKNLKVIAVPANSDLKSLPPGAIQDAELLGSLGTAQPGATMTLDKIREFQTYR